MTAPVVTGDRPPAPSQPQPSPRPKLPGRVASSSDVTHDDPSREAFPILRGVRAAFAFFTRIPVGGFPYGDRALAWAPAHAPLVGGVVGLALGILDACLLPLGALP